MLVSKLVTFLQSLYSNSKIVKTSFLCNRRYCLVSLLFYLHFHSVLLKFLRLIDFHFPVPFCICLAWRNALTKHKLLKKSHFKNKLSRGLNLSDLVHEYGCSICGSIVVAALSQGSTSWRLTHLRSPSESQGFVLALEA